MIIIKTLWRKDFKVPIDAGSTVPIGMELWLMGLKFCTVSFWDIKAPDALVRSNFIRKSTLCTVSGRMLKSIWFIFKTYQYLRKGGVDPERYTKQSTNQVYGIQYQHPDCLRTKPSLPSWASKIHDCNSITDCYKEKNSNLINRAYSYELGVETNKTIWSGTDVNVVR